VPFTCRANSFFSSGFVTGGGDAEEDSGPAGGLDDCPSFPGGEGGVPGGPGLVVVGEVVVPVEVVVLVVVVVSVVVVSVVDVVVVVVVST
jgi:hypothetical protein